MDLQPHVPYWALEAGLPAPREGEAFEEYVRRLGLDPEPMLAGLSEQSLVLANQRLASTLIRALPDDFQEYLEARRGIWR